MGVVESADMIRQIEASVTNEGYLDILAHRAIEPDRITE
jgi:hypothetical protein